MGRQKEELKKQHPVPQNIMEVEFKLVGDLTLRQFGYVAAGAILGYIIYAQPLTGLIRWPLIVLDAALALGMAFLPMEERGLDEWLRNFFTAVYSPTQRIWKSSATKQKTGTAPAKKQENPQKATKKSGLFNRGKKTTSSTKERQV